MDAPSGWELLRLHLQQPEYLHVLLNPLPVYGLGLGGLAMLTALALRNRRSEIVALTIVFVSALAAWPVAQFGGRAYDRVASLSDADGQAWLENHAQRADSVLWVFYAVAALSVAAVFVPVKWPRARRPLFVLTLAGVFAGFACGAWIGYAGGQVRHKEFRYGPPPSKVPAAY